MTNVATLFQSNQGTSVPAGYIGEIVSWGALNTISTITSSSSRLGGSASTITLNKGIYLIFVAGYGAVPAAVSFSTNVAASSGAGTFTGLSTIYSSPMNDTTTLNNYNFVYHAVITQDSTVVEITATVSSGSYSCRFTQGRAIRIA